MKQRKPLSFTFSGFFKFISMKIRGRSILVTGSCKGCGTCCKSISIEGAGGWLREKADFKKIVEKQPEYGRFEITGRDSRGFLLFRCNMLSLEDKCSSYDKRLPMCKHYPDKSLVFMGGKVVDGCGYKHTTVVPFKKVLAKELKNRL